MRSTIEGKFLQTFQKISTFFNTEFKNYELPILPTENDFNGNKIHNFIVNMKNGDKLSVTISETFKILQITVIKKEKRTAVAEMKKIVSYLKNTFPHTKKIEICNGDPVLSKNYNTYDLFVEEEVEEEVEN